MRLLSSLALMAFAPIALAGCNTCFGTYNCPSSGKYALLDESELPSPVIDASTDSPCAVTVETNDAGPSSVQVTDPRDGTTTCHVTGHLADGRAVTANVTFQPMSLGCCTTVKASGGTFGLVTDAGAP